MCLGTLYVIDAWVNWGFSFFDKFALVFNSSPESLASFLADWRFKTGAIEVTATFCKIGFMENVI